MSPSVDWEDVAKRMAAGEVEAHRLFAKLFGKKLAFFFLRKGLGSADAEDLAVSCVGDIALKIEKYRRQGKGYFKAWVYTIAERYRVNWLRKQNPKLPLREDMTTEMIIDTVDPNIDKVLAVQDGMNCLSEGEQQIIRLRDLGDEQLSYKEISQILDISIGAARTRYFRALQELERVLEKDPRVMRFLNKS